MILFTQLNIPMTTFKVDVVVGGTKKENILVQKSRYGFKEEDLQDIENNECVSIISGANGLITPQRIFLLSLKKPPQEDIPTMIHELWHLMWHISEIITDFNLNQDTQTWAACMIETLAEQIMNNKYEELNLEYGE